MTDRPYQVVVAGGGPAGAVTALSLARAGLRVLLVERGPDRRPPLGETLPAAAGRLLRWLGIDAGLAAPHLPCPGTLTVWGSPDPVATSSLLDPEGAGWRLDRPVFDQRLRAAAELAGVEVRQDALVSRPVPGDGGGVELELTGGGRTDRLRCDWLVDATGRGATLARRLGGRVLVSDRLVATVGLFDSPDPDARVWLEAVEDGWWYGALLPDGRRVLARLTEPGLVTVGSAAGSVGLAGLAALAGTQLGGRLAGAVPAGPSGRRWAGSTRLASGYGPGWVAAGDAVLSFDPLSGRGMLTALLTGALAGRALAAHLAGEPDALAGYQRAVQALHRDYRSEQAHYYGLERRWPAAPFWRARHQRSS